MKKNIGIIDRIARFAIGVVLLILAIYQQSIIFGIAAIFCFYEALASWCIVYRILGRNTCPISKK